jgi:hypothetical protein
MIRYGNTHTVLLQQGSDELRFSNTMEWDKTLEKEVLIVDPAVLKRLRLDPPPTNMESMGDEIHELLKKQRMRTPEQTTAIVYEKSLKGIISRFGVDDKQFLYDADSFITPYIMHFKRKFDRARPRALEPQVKPCIEPPGHPAYPSGHATQAYTFGFLLARKHPGRAEHFMKVAHGIATNREWAGVHYMSDTVAGKELARQLVEQM